MAPQLDDKNPAEKRPASMRKVEANRRNALKSTGPRTPRGKAYSRQNAFKHGLFMRDQNIFGDAEDPQEFAEFYRRLRDELQPVGPSEEIEVQYIAICWWRLQRLWRYENAELEAGSNSVAEDAINGLYYPTTKSPACAAQMKLLLAARDEAEETGQIPEELLGKILAGNMSLSFFWPTFEQKAEKKAQEKQHDIAKRIAEERRMTLSEAEALLVRDPKSLPERQRFLAVQTIQEVISFLFEAWNSLFRSSLQNECLRQLIPHDRDVDKIIRYGSAFERQLSRAYDRLERLQRRRGGERIPLPVSVHLTQ